MKKIYLIVGAILWGGIVDAQTLSVEQYRQKVLEYNRKLFLSVGEGGVLARNRPETR